MGRTVSDILQQVDILATECCTAMSEEQREGYFKYREDRKAGGNMYKAKYCSERVYYKGKNAGQPREIFHIRDRQFTELWRQVEAYVSKASAKSNYYRVREDIEDDISEVKFLLLRVLRYFGPRPSGHSLSKMIKLIVNNVLTNSYQTKARSFEYIAVPKFEAVDGTGQGITNAAELEEADRAISRARELGKASEDAVSIYPRTKSLYTPISSEGESLHLLDTMEDATNPTNAVEDTLDEFLRNIPPRFVPVITELVGGKSMFAACKKGGFTRAGECWDAMDEEGVLSWNYRV